MRRSRRCWSRCAPTPAGSRATWRRCGASWTGRSRPGRRGRGTCWRPRWCGRCGPGRLGFEDLKRVALSALAEIAAASLRTGLDSLFGGKAAVAGAARPVRSPACSAPSRARRARRSAARSRPAAPIWSASAGRSCSCRPRAGGSRLRPGDGAGARGAGQHQHQRPGGRRGAGAGAVEPAGGAGGEGGAAAGGGLGRRGVQPIRLRAKACQASVLPIATRNGCESR